VKRVMGEGPWHLTARNMSVHEDAKRADRWRGTPRGPVGEMRRPPVAPQAYSRTRTMMTARGRAPQLTSVGTATLCPVRGELG